jgi:hypothetical protein
MSSPDAFTPHQPDSSTHHDAAPSAQGARASRVSTRSPLPSTAAAARSAELLLPKPIPPIPMGKLQATVPTALLTELERYRDAYRDINEAEIHFDAMVAHMLCQHLRRDKAFLNWLELSKFEPLST